MPKIYKDAVGKEYSYDDLIKTIGTPEGADSFIKRKGMKLKPQVDVFNKTRSLALGDLGKEDKPIVEEPVVEEPKPVIKKEPTNVFNKTVKKPVTLIPEIKPIKPTKPVDPLGFSNLEPNKLFQPKPVTPKYNIDYNDLTDKPTDYVKSSLQKKVGDDYVVSISSTGTKDYQNGIVNTAVIKSKKTGEATSFVVPRTLTKQTAVGPLSSIENAPTEFDRLHINGFLNENSTDSKLYKTTGIPKSMVSKMHLTKEGDKPMNDDEKAEDLMNNRIPSLKGYLVNNLPKLVDESIGATQSYNKAIGDPESLEKIKDYISKDKNISELYGVDKSYTDIIVSKYLQKLAKDEKAKLDDTTSEYMATLPNAPKYFREQFANEQSDAKLKTLAQKSNGLESIKTNLYELEQQALTGKKVDVIAQANLKTQLGLQEKEFNKLQKEAFGTDTKFYINNSDYSHVPESKVTTKDPSKVSDISKDVHTALSLYAGTPREGLQRAWIDVNKKWYGIKKHAEEKINVVIPGIKYGDEGTYRLLDIKTNAIANGGEVMYNKSGEMIVKNVPRKVIDTWGTGMEIFSFKGGKKAENIDNDLNEWSQYSKGVVADRTALGYLNVFNVKPESIDLGFKESGKNFVKALGNELFKTFAPKDYRTGEVSEGFKIETNRTLADNISKVVDINRLKIDEKDKKHLEKNLGEVISQTTTGIIPVVVELGMVEAATEGLGTIGALTTAGSKVAKLWDAYKVGNAWQKGVYHTTKIVWEEAKMQGVLGAKAGSGAGFYIGGNLARLNLLSLSPRWRMINNVVNTGLSAGLGGVAGGKIGGMLEGAISDITGQQEYKEFIKEHYGTLSGDTKQNIADLIVFGALGVSHLKSNDLKSIGSINASVNEVQGKMLTLNKEVNDLFNMQQNLDPKSTEHKDIQKQIDANQEKYNDYQYVLDPLKQIQRNEDLRYTLARDDKKLAAYLSSVSGKALETINKQEENKLNPVTFAIKSLGNGVTSSYDAKTKEIVINKDRLYGQDPFTGAYDYLQLGVIPHEVLHAMGTAMFPKVEVLDADGKPAKDKNGEPIMRDDYGKWNGFADMVMSSAENPLHRPLTQEEDITFEQAIEKAYSDTAENVRNTPEEKVAWTMQRLQDQNVDTYSLMKDVKQDIVGWWERKTGRGPVINNGKDLLDFLDRMNRSVLNSKNAEKQYEKFRDIDISDFTINNEILSNIDKQIIAEKGGEPVRKESINIIQDYVRKNNPRGLDAETSKDLMEDLRTKIEDYWGKVPDHQVKLMYQNIDHAEDVIENRSLEKGSIYQIANKGLNLALVKNVEQRLNNFINLAERNRIQPDQPSVKESKDLESLTKEKDALKNANIAMARREGGMTDADRETAKENYNRILEINKEIERVGLPAGNEKISDANVKASNRNKELMSIIKDPETKAGSLQKATDALLENNIGAIQKLVKSKFDTLREEGAMTKEDLLQNVKIDFLNLVRTFDPAKNDNFGAYMAPLLKRRIAAHFAEASIIKTKVSKSGMDKELKSILTPEQLRKVRDIEEDAKDYGLSPEEVTSEIKDLLTDEQLDEWNAIEDKYQEKVYTDSLSGEFAPDLMDTAEEHDFEIVDRDIHDEKVQLHKDLELDENVMKAIDDSIIKTMKEDLPAIDGKGFKIALKNSLANKIHTELLARVGRSMDYRRYLSNHWKTMFDAIPISVMTQSFRPWVKNSLDANGNKRREQTQVGLFIYEKNKVTKEEFMDYFTGEITPNSPGTLSARKKSLLAAVGNQVAYNSMIDMFANNREFRAMYENKQALLNNELADNYIAQLALKLDRETPDVKYSKDLTPLLIRDLGKVFEENKDLKTEVTLDKVIDKFNLVGLPDTAKKELLVIIETANKILTKSTTENTFVNQVGYTEPQIKESKKLEVNKEFNKILEEKTGISATKILNRPEAYDFAANKGKWRFFVPPNTEDFAGMMYNFLPTGEKGNKAQEFFNKNLFRPYAEGMDSYEKDKVRILKLYKGAKERFNITPELLKSPVGKSKFTHDQAIRFYLWNKQKDITIEGVGAKDLANLIKTVNGNYKLKAFAEYLDTMLGRKKGYVKFDKSWNAGTIASDIIEYIETKIREGHLKPWKENVNIIFDEDNKNKILATQGQNFISNLNSRLRHMETGKIQGKSNPVTDWLLGSTANIMFLNTRSAILQISAAGNYVDWKNNNPADVARAFANQKQFWSDFNMLWNSHYLSDRRGGMKFDLVAEDLATMSQGDSGYKQLMAKAKTFGFKPTVYGDSIAIAFGGASFYRNTYDALIKEGYSSGEANKKAMIEWQEKSEDTQQSNRPDKISNIQTSPWGKIIFSFSNTSMQYNRIIKKSFLDLSQGRGDAKEHISKILYYGVINNALFNILQSALFNVFLGGNDDSKTTKEKEFDENPQLASALDGMLDTLLKGAGGYGAILSVLKNMAEKAYEQRINGRLDATKIAQTALSVSPSISRKMQQLEKLWTIFANKQLREQATTKGLAWDNPAIPAAAGGISMVANIPADRIFQKLNNYKDILDANHTTASRIENFLGYSRLNQGYDDRPAPDVLTPKQRLEYEEYKKELPDFTEANYMEQKNVAPKAVKENRKTWLYIFRDIKKPKDPLTPKQRSEFIEYQKALPGFTMDNYIEQKNITVDPELATDWEKYEKLVRQKVNEDKKKE